MIVAGGQAASETGGVVMRRLLLPLLAGDVRREHQVFLDQNVTEYRAGLTEISTLGMVRRRRPEVDGQTEEAEEEIQQY